VKLKNGKREKSDVRDFPLAFTGLGH